MNLIQTLALCSLLAACGGQVQRSDEALDSARIFSQVVATKAEFRPLSILANPADPLSPEQWHFRNFGQISSKGVRGVPGADIHLGESELLSDVPPTEITVAVIDSGIDLTHADLDLSRLDLNLGETGTDENGQDKGKNGRDDDQNGLVDDQLGWSFANNSPDTNDTLGHGTHVAGLLVARSQNALGLYVPWRGLKVLPLQIFSSKRPAPTAETIAEAIRYAVRRGARVISASFGTPSYSAIIKDAIELALKNDVLLVSAVGNFRKNQDYEPSYPAGFNLENQIAVGASERRDLAAQFSNFGTRVDVFAPGEEIISLGLNSSFVVRSGTSQAAPLVAAAAATARLLYPNATAPEIKRLLLEAADELPGLSGFSKTARRLNVENIIRGRTGLRKAIFDFEHWKTEPLALESEHPYRANLRSEKSVIAPEGSRFLRLEFEKFSTQSSDTLEILDQNNRVVVLLSGELGTFWTPVIPAEKLTLRFTTDRYVSDFGWKISRIQYTD
jgi:hypothetical protein